MGRRCASVAAAALMLLAVIAVAQDQEESVPLDKVPKAVLDAVKARFADAKLMEASKEKEDGKQVYEVTIKDKGQTVDVTLTPEGSIIMIERAIPPAKLPPAVSKAVDEKYPKATIKIAEEIFKVDQRQEKLAYYEVQLVTGQKILEVVLAPDGKVLKEERDEEDKK